MKISLAKETRLIKAGIEIGNRKCLERRVHLIVNGIVRGTSADGGNGTRVRVWLFNHPD